MAGLNKSGAGYQGQSEGYYGQAGQMANQQRGLGSQMQGLSNQMQGAGTEQMGKWGGRADQMFGMASGIASREPSWYADRAAVTSNQAFDESKGVQDRALSRMGINSNSGRFVGLQTQWGLARAAAEAGAKTKAQQDAEATTFERQKGLAGMANQQYGQGAGMVNAAGSQLSAAGGQLGAAAENYHRLGNTYDRVAGEAQENKVVKDYSGSGKIQSRIDDLLAQMPGQVAYGQPDPATGKLRLHPDYIASQQRKGIFA